MGERRGNAAIRYINNCGLSLYDVHNRPRIQIMRTRAVQIPVIHDDDDTIIADTPLDGGTIVGMPAIGTPTQDLDSHLRPPALDTRFLVKAAFEAGAPTDVIADSIALGETWVTGSAILARDCLILICLSDPAVPAEKRMAAWRPLNQKGTES